MKIERISIRRICNPINRPYVTAFGSQSAFNSILVSLESGGLTGWGEAAPGGGPFFSPYTDETSFCIARDFIAPRILGREISSGAELQELLQGIRGNEFAKAAFDVALWDLLARQDQLPLYRRIGGSGNVARVGYTFGVLNSYDELLAGIEKVTASGYPRVKLKFCPGWELEMLAVVRAAFPALTIHIDCNSAYTLADLPLLQELDRFHLAMIEQPLRHNDLLDHAELQRRITTPICLDESITSVQEAEQAIRIGAARFINIKYGRVGGITAALQIHALCGEHGIGCWLGGMGESSLGTTVVAALATLPNVNYPSDISPAEKFYVRNLGTPVLSTDRPGTYTLREEPGLDVVPEPDALRDFTVAAVHFEAPC
ncbi:MAG: o-succinylbenzoate synthase [Oligosphaeraceae bacterium]|nr:o-succinylbenzoate synthase [Oligosphaeraceae bacterium]